MLTLRIVVRVLICTQMIHQLAASDEGQGGGLPPGGCPVGQFFEPWYDGCRYCGCCINDMPCNNVTGECEEGCKDWHYPEKQCWGHITDHASYLTLAHINDGPEVKDIRPDRVEVCFYQNQTLVQHGTAKYYKYQIQYATLDSSRYAHDIDLISVQEELLIHKDVVGLTPNTEYRFRIALIRVFEDRLYDVIDYSPTTTEQTPCTLPDIPQFSRVTIDESLTSVHLEWRPFGRHNCDRYTNIKLWLTNGTVDDGSRESVLTLLQPQQTSYTAHNLHSHASYLFQLDALNNKGHGSQSRPKVQVDLIPQNAGQVIMILPDDGDDDDEGSEEVGAGDDDSDDDDDVSTTSLIIGVAVPSAVALVAIIIAVVLFIKLRRSKNAATSKRPPQYSPSPIPAAQASLSSTRAPVPLPSYDVPPPTGTRPQLRPVVPPRDVSAPARDSSANEYEQVKTGTSQHPYTGLDPPHPYSYADVNIASDNPTYNMDSN